MTAIAYGFHNSVLLVAVADPTDDRGLDEVREAVGRRVRFKVALQSEIESALADAFGEPLGGLRRRSLKKAGPAGRIRLP